MKTFLLIILLLTGPAFAGSTPVEIDPAPHASVTVQTRSWGGRFYVSGVAKNLPVGHKHADFRVDVELLGADGQRLAVASDDINQHSHPRTPHGRAGRYVVSFPADAVREAKLVRVIVHDHAHKECPRARHG